MAKTLFAQVLPWAGMAGTEVGTLRLAAAARSGGRDSVIYVPDGAASADLEAMLQDCAFQVTRFKAVPLSRRNLPAFALAQLALARDFRRRKVKVVHCADILGAMYVGPAARLAGARLISHVRCDHPRLFPMEKRLLALVQHFVFVSHAAWARLDFPVPSERGEVLYDGICARDPILSQAEARAHYGLPCDEIVIGMAARFNAQKDHATLIRAARLVRERGQKVRVLLAGDMTVPHEGEQVREIVDLVRQTGCEDTVHFCGFEPRMERFYAALDIFALSTHFEGLPLVLLEAMAAGKPVVASRVSGVPELLGDDGAVGLTVPESDPQALADTLCRLAGDAELRANMGSAGRTHVCLNFSESRFRRRVISLYDRLAAWTGDARRLPTLPADPVRETEAGAPAS